MLCVPIDWILLGLGIICGAFLLRALVGTGIALMLRRENR